MDLTPAPGAPARQEAEARLQLDAHVPDGSGPRPARAWKQTATAAEREKGRPK